MALGLQAVALLLCMQVTGRLQPEVVPDTPTYVDFPLDDPQAAAIHIRTYGYPLFLQLDPTADHRWTPTLHVVVHVASVFAIWAALLRWNFPPLAATVVVSGLLWSLTLMRYGQMLTPDSLAHSLALLSIALLLILITASSRRWWWCLLAVTIVATYQCRPAYVFLVPWIPLLGTALAWWRSVGPDRTAVLTVSTGLRWLGALSLVTAAPLLLFCTYRYVLVGHFGLVAFGGYNSAGTICQFLEEEDIPRLPADLRELAKRGIVLRQQVYAERNLPLDVTTSYITIERRFDASTWGTWVQAARSIWPDEPLLVNRRLAELARHTAWLHKKSYAIWLVKAAARGCYLMAAEWTLNGFVLVMLLAWLALHLERAYREKLAATPSAANAAACSSDIQPIDVTVLPLLIGVSFAVTKLMLVILTTPPLGRFVDPAAVWLPAILAAIVSRQWLGRRSMESV